MSPPARGHQLDEREGGEGGVLLAALIHCRDAGFDQTVSVCAEHSTALVAPGDEGEESAFMFKQHDPTAPHASL